MPVGGRPAVADALEHLEQWRKEEHADLERGLAALAEEEGLVQKALAESQRQLKALSAVRQDLEKQLEQLDQEQQYRAWEAVQRSLAADRSMLKERAALLYQANRDKRARILAELSGKSLQSQLQAVLSAGWHRTGLPDSLRPFLLALEIPARVSVARCSVAVIASTDPEEGRVQVLLLLTPVPYTVWSDWSARTDPVPDLCMQLAWRILAATYQLLAQVSASDAPVQFMEVSGNLAIQVWLGDHQVPDDFRERTMEAIQGGHADAAELESAGVDVYGFWLKPELVGLESE